MRTSIISFYPEDTPIATGLIGEAALPSVINGKIITHESSTLSLAKIYPGGTPKGVPTSQLITLEPVLYSKTGSI